MLLSTLLFNTLLAQTAPEVLRKPVGKGAYEMAYSPSENALYRRRRRAASWTRAASFTV